MFGILKKKFSKLVESITKRVETKPEPIEKEEIKKPDEEKVLPKEEVSEKKVVEVPTKEIKEEVGEKPEEMIKEVEKKIPEKIEDKPAEVIKSSIEIVEKKPALEVIEEGEKLEEKKSWITRIREKIVKKVVEKKLDERDLEPILNELETDLIESDAAYEVAQKIKKDLKENLLGRAIKRGKEKEIINNILRQTLLEILSVPRINFEEVIKKSKTENRPAVLLFFGMNGVGKSLNLTKTARWLQKKGYRPILAAGDTYRAAGDTQLELYAEKINVPVIKHQRGADSCAVIFDARKAAESRGYDVVLGDTSGRMHTKKDLMDELEKIVRVNKPDLKILVLDSLSGSDVIQQFEFFDKVVKVDAVIFSKVDVNEKGGNILSICHSFKRPILFLGVGQEMEDLMEYSPEKFVDNMLA